MQDDVWIVIGLYSLKSVLKRRVDTWSVKRPVWLVGYDVVGGGRCNIS